MFNKIRNCLVNKYISIKNKFLVRALVIYSIIIIISLVLVIVVITVGVKRITRSNEIQVYNILIKNIDDYIEDKAKFISTVVKSPFINDPSIDGVLSYLSSSASSGTKEYMELRIIFDRYYNSIFSWDKDCNEIYVYKKMNNKTHVFSKNIGYTPDKIILEGTWKIDRSSDIFYRKPALYPIPEYYNKSDIPFDIYYFSMPLMNNSDITENLGSILCGFDSKGIIENIKSEGWDNRCRILLTTKIGTPIYDSDPHKQKINPEMLVNIKEQMTLTLPDKNRYLAMIYQNTDLEYNIYAFIPEYLFLKKATPVNSIIVITILLSLFLCIIFIIISSRSFSKRLHSLTDAIEGTSRSDMPKKVNLSGPKDELEHIAASYNRMIENLNQYIKRSYVMEIRQKSAQLKAIQAQLKPHFLYNTLDAIRLKAMTSGRADIGDMIYTLVYILRSTIKKDVVIPLSEELRLCESYLSLMKTRYGESFSYNVQIPSSIMSLSIIKFMLQPLVENAVKHGYNSDNNFFHINLLCTIDKENNKMIVTVRDNGCGIKKVDCDNLNRVLQNPCFHYDSISNTNNLGLVSISERISLIFGNQYGIKLNSILNEGTTVTAILPAINKEELIGLVYRTHC